MGETPGKMLSSLTVAEKPRSKPAGCVGIFFQLFDWNRRFARKKLFSNRFLLGARPKKASKKFGDEKLPMAKLLLIADENRGGFPDTKKSAGGGSSKVTDNKRNSVRSPGIVARLMGLESMPARASSESPSLESQKLQTQRTASESLDDDQCSKFGKNLVECRPQKLQKTGIFERRPVIKSKKEPFPFKSVVSRSRRHHQKLMSPVKSSGVLHGRNAARLMEAATKILEPGLLATSRAKCALPCSVKPHLACEDMAARELRYIGYLSDDFETLRATTDDQEAVDFSSSYSNANIGDNGDSSERKSNPLVPSPEQEKGVARNLQNGKSGVQKNEERLKSNAKRMSEIVEIMDSRKPYDQKEHEQDIPDKKCNTQKFKQTNIKVSDPPDELKLSNQKLSQILSSKDTAHEHANKYTRRCSSCEASKESAVFSRNLNNLAQNRAYTNDLNQWKDILKDKEVKKSYCFDKKDDPLSRANASRHKKRPVGGNSHSGMMGSAVRPNERKGRLSTASSKSTTSKDHPSSPNSCKMQRPKHACYQFPLHVGRHMDGNGNDANIVSFTFTSSVNPPSSVSSNFQGRKSNQAKFVCGASKSLNDPCGKSRSGFQQKKRCSNVNNRKLTSHETKEQGDSLSVLLEKKLKELTSKDGIELSKLLSKNCSAGQSETPERAAFLILQELISALTAKTSASQELQKASLLGYPDGDSLHVGYLAETECSSTSDGMINEAQSPQEVTQGFVGNRKLFGESPCENKNSFDCSIGSDAKTKISRFPFLNDSAHPSPVSILDASFSNESCFSSESFDGCRASQLRLSFIDCSPRKFQQFDADMELIDSATSWNNGNMGRGRIDIDYPQICSADEDSIEILTEDTSTPPDELELLYVRKVLSGVELTFENIMLFGADLPHFSNSLLFQNLETMVDKHSKSKNILDFMKADGYHRRRLVFDCVMEYLSLKFGRYSRAVYRALGKLPLSMNQERLSKEAYQEVSMHRNLAGRILDEIVEWDMNTPLSKWTDFEIEAFETALEIENKRYFSWTLEPWPLGLLLTKSTKSILLKCVIMR